MPKAKNVYFYSTNADELDRVASEYEYLGRNVRRFKDHVAVYAYPKKKVAAKPRREPAKDESAPKPTTEQRSKRERWYE